MSAKLRFALGFVVGLILTACALVPTAAGHGTYAPLVAAASFLALVPVLGILGTPFLWAIYYTVIPAIDSRIMRGFVVVSVLLLHLLPGLWLAFEDPAFTRQLAQNPSLLVIFCLLWSAAFIVLTVLSAGAKPGRPDQ